MALTTLNWKEERRCKYCNGALVYNVGMPALFQHKGEISRRACPHPYPIAKELGDSITWDWHESLIGYAHCGKCSAPIRYVNAGKSWKHAVLSFTCHDIQVLPKLHNLQIDDIDSMGYAHGLLGAKIIDNPYCASNPFYDGVDSMGEAGTWWQGWSRAQKQLGKIPSEPEIVVAPLDGLDWLENERG